MPGGTWTPGATQTAPENWKIIGSSYDVPYSIEVKLLSGKTVPYQLWNYHLLGHVREKSAIHPYKGIYTYYGYYYDHSYFDTEADLYVVLSAPEGFRDKFKVKDWAGGVSECTEWPPKNCYWLEDFDASSSYIAYEGLDINETETSFGPPYLMSTYSQSSSHYQGMALPEYLPTNFTAEIERTYNEAEINYLKELGLAPVEYTIKFSVE